MIKTIGWGPETIMALNTCPFCRAALSSLAPTCPACGRAATGPEALALVKRRLRRRAIRRLVRMLVIASICGIAAAIATRHARDAVASPGTVAAPSAPASPSPPPRMGGAPRPVPTATPAAPTADTAAAVPAPAPHAAATVAGVAGPAAADSTAEPASDIYIPAYGPTQPATGPGSSWSITSFVLSCSFGTGDTQYWLFEPETPRAHPLPVVVFLHGWSAMEPQAYMAWIEHIVKRGNIVIYPRYQASLTSPPQTFTATTIAALAAAFTELQRPDAHVLPDLAHVTCVGHSFGGLLAANLAALSATDGLPPLRAVMAVEPGGGRNRVYQDYAKIPAGTLLLCVAGEDDHIAGVDLATRIMREATAVAATDRDYILMRSDRHGDPALVANHFAPAARGGCGCWFGLWKWFDALQSAADTNQDRDAALGNTARQRFMGTWSDGQAVVEPLITASP